MKVKTIVSTLLLAVVTASPLAFAKDVIHTFHANDKKYEVYVGYGDSIYVNYGGSTDTKYVKGSGYGGCNWKYYGSCVSKPSMISDIEYKVSANKY